MQRKIYFFFLYHLAPIYSVEFTFVEKKWRKKSHSQLVFFMNARNLLINQQSTMFSARIGKTLTAAERADEEQLVVAHVDLRNDKFSNANIVLIRSTLNAIFHSHHSDGEYLFTLVIHYLIPSHWIEFIQVVSEKFSQRGDHNKLLTECLQNYTWNYSPVSTTLSACAGLNFI